MTRLALFVSTWQGRLGWCPSTTAGFSGSAGTENEHPLAKRKKTFNGNQLIDLLARHGIYTQVRHPVPNCRSRT
jgi:hypothetical protein